MELRPYQIEVKNKVYNSLKAGNKHILLQLPTGAGKTILFTSIAKEAIEKGGKTVWVLVHRKELIDQTIQKAAKYGLQFSVIQQDYAYRPFVQYQVASVQTLVRRLDNINYPPDLIITDECHHSLAESYKKIYAKYPASFHIGVSATPIRTNGEGFVDIFDDIVCGPSVKKLIVDGWLVKPRIFAHPLTFDLSKVKITAGDYNEKALYEAYKDNFTYGNLVESWRSKAECKKTVVFAINVEHSKSIINAYTKENIPAEHIDGTTPKSERDAIIRRFRDGTTLVLSNVGIVTEGFDLPDIEAVQLVRPTKSLGLYLQIVGRGLRPANNKAEAIILDHSNSIFAHGFPDQDRIWTLKGIYKNGNANKKVMVYDKTENQIYDSTELKHNNDIELVEIDVDEIRLNIMKELVEITKKRKFKIGYAWYKFIEKFPVPTIYEIHKFCRIANYNQKWIDYKIIEYGLN
jgi:superfamily II DNA or RNA helicase